MAEDNKTPDFLREFDDTKRTRDNIYNNTLEAMKKRFPVEDDNYRLELIDPHYEGNQDYSLSDQKKALLHNRNLRTNLVGTWRLTDKKTGKVLDERKDSIMQVPYWTDRGTIINNGSEYTVISQARLRPGVYARKKSNGEYECQFNIKPGTGRAFHFGLNPENGVMTLQTGQGSVPLYQVLKGFGVDDKEIIKYWGADVTAQNSQKVDAQAWNKLYSKMAGSRAVPNLTEADKIQFIKEAISKYEVDPEVVERTMGLRNTTAITPQLLLRASQKLLNISRGDEKPDNRDNPRYSKYYGVEDYFKERIEKNAGRLTNSLLFKARRNKNLKSIQRNALNPWVDTIINGSGLAMPGEEANPLSTLEQMSRISKFGLGGIGSADAVTMEARDVQGDYLGFVDNVAGPESASIGVDVRASYRTFLGKDNKLYGEFINNKTGKKEFIDVATAADKMVAFPGQDMSKPYVMAIKDGIPQKVKREEVGYVVPSYAHVVGSNTNMNPMPTAVQAGRQFYGSKFWSQYLPQANGQVPLVDSLMDDGKTTWSEYYGRKIGTLKSNVDGVVTKVDDNMVTIKGNDGKTYKTELVKSLPFNRLTGISYSPSVEVGQTIKSGEMIAHSNFTDKKTGSINMGQNLYVAIVPNGKSFEDGHTISESAAKRLATDRLYSFDHETRNGVIADRNKYISAFPSKFTKEQVETLDEHGVVKPGTILHRGDPIVLSLGPKMLSSSDKTLGKLSKALRNSFTDRSEIWEHDYEGRVVDSAITSKGVKVNVSAQPPVREGDKLCYDPLTEVLTIDGWKKISDLTLNDNVATLDPSTGYFNYLKPELLHSYHHNGKMYHATSKTIDVLVTPNHKMYVRRKGNEEFEFINAEDIYNSKESIEYKSDGLWEGNEGNEITYRSFPQKLLRHRLGVELSTETRLDIELFLEKLGNFLSERDNEDNSELFGKDRIIPDFVFCLSSRLQNILLNSILFGRGNTKKLSHNKKYEASSKELADDIQRLCLHCGYSATIDSLSKSRYVVKIQVGNPSILSRRYKHEYVDYNGLVYCCTMPKWHAIYVRRNGKAYWCGNSGRFGLKGVVAQVIPDDQMPRNSATNQPYDVLMNPMGFLSRVAPGQLMEISLGKIAKQTGQQIRIPQLPPQEGWYNWVQNQMKANGVQETSDIFDPASGKTIKGVGDGYIYMMAFHHLAEKKASALGNDGSYTQDEQPAKGGFEGAKRVSGLDLWGMLSHNVPDVIKDSHVIRGQRNDAYWQALQLGYPVPEPDTPFIYKKFLNTLRAGGVNVTEKGSITKIMPQTDKDIDDLAQGRTISSSEMVDSDFEPVNGGLFDLGKTGGMSGNQWSMIKLPEPVPNPIMEEPIRRVLGITVTKLGDILSGKDTIDGKTGGQAIKEALSKIDVDKRIEESKRGITTLRGQKRDDAIKQYRYLTAMKEQGLRPQDWMISKVPVIPPAFRPVSKMGDVALVSDMNELYKDIIENAKSFEELRKDVDDSGLTEERMNIYNSVKAAYGLGQPITPENAAKGVKGAIRQVIGDRPKTGQFQAKVLSKTVNGVARGVTVADPNYDMNTIGMPESMAWPAYKPYVMRALVRNGYPATTAIKMIADRTDTARHVLEEEMSRRPVIMDRAPTWHKFNFTAFYPKLVDGDKIVVSPLVDGAYNMDHDGDESRSPYITAWISDKFFYTLAVDTKTKLCYDPCITKKVIEDRKMYKENAVVNGVSCEGTVVSLRWDEFPHYDNPTMNSHPNAHFYLVPEGVAVRAYDEKTGKIIWAPVKYWSHHGVNEKLEIVTVELSSGRQILTDDDPRGVYGIDPETMEFGRWRPKEAIGKFVPRCINDTIIDSELKGIELSDYTDNRITGTMPLDRVSGWFLGATAGDGWDTKLNGEPINVCFSYDRNYNDLGSYYKIALQHSLYKDEEVHFTKIEHNSSSESGRYGDAITIRHSSKAAGILINTLIGHGAENKHLPTFWQRAPKDFRLGLFEGLMDTDGTLALTKSKAKKNKQLICNYTSVSMTLATEVQYLCRTLGIDSKLTAQKTPKGGKFWQVSISTKNLKSIGLDLKSSHKAKALSDATIQPDSSVGGRKYMIPVPVRELKKVSGILLSLDKSSYITFNRTSKKGYVPTTIADKIAKVLKAAPELQTELWKKWLSLYDKLDNVVWERVEGFTNTGMFEEGYDLTVPGYETFMNSEGVILSNTVNLHVPSSDKAVAQAKAKMLPSSNLISLTDLSSPRYQPSKEQIFGLYALTKEATKKPVKVFNTASDAKQAYARGEIGPNDPIEIRDR